ncbi:hypothetical protein EW146_g9907 [Bondarzewia mesenterica]|uniref:Uncharacterized protein n=1 Tax=Bondarzewia mesenterica TaxID=1095465 RepID=A0A4S4L270_9AGAM|nr:hypothetical protein EW146_g9907 [Bondarzewia mesenterica]
MRGSRTPQGTARVSAEAPHSTRAFAQIALRSQLSHPPSRYRPRASTVLPSLAHKRRRECLLFETDPTVDAAPPALPATLKVAAPPSATKKKQPYPFWLGGVAATIAASITHPLDLTKVRLQASGDKRMIESLKKTVRTAGFRGLFDGISGTWMRQMSYSLCRFWAYDESKKLIGAGPNAPAWKLAAAGSMGASPPLPSPSVRHQTHRPISAAGGIAGLVGNPGEIVMVRRVALPLPLASLPSPPPLKRKEKGGEVANGHRRRVRSQADRYLPSLFLLPLLTHRGFVRAFLAAPSDARRMPSTRTGPTAYTAISFDIRHSTLSVIRTLT